MKIRLLVIGKLKDAYLRDAYKDYAKRLGKYVTLECEEFPDLATIENPSTTQKEEIKNKECAKVLAKIKPRDYVVLLDLGAKQFSSEELANQLEKWFVSGGSEVTFVIGGSTGLSQAMKQRGNAVLSLSELTFTHGFTRVILLEQLYRSFKILHHEPYNK